MGRGRLVLSLSLALALCVAAAPGADGAKKKAKAKAFSATVTVNAPVPDGVAGTRSVPLVSKINVGKSYKGKVVGDVNVTGVQTTGSGPGAADDVNASLTAPNGRTVTLFGGAGDQSIGPWTIDDDSPVSICNAVAPPCIDSTQSLNRPFAGTANTIRNIGGGFPSSGPLSTFNGGRMNGTWTLTVWDPVNPSGMGNGTSVFNKWGLKITPAKPVPAAKTKPKPFATQINPGAPVPDAAPPARSVPLSSTITVGSKFKGKVVGDVNVTGLRTTGSAAGAANDLFGYLVAPSGRTLQLWQVLGDQSIGPWTLDDESPAAVCNLPAAARCNDPGQSLNQPFAGTSNVAANWLGAFPVNGTLAIFNGVKMQGKWTLLLSDDFTGGGNGTSVLNSWGLKITPAKPVTN